VKEIRALVIKATDSSAELAEQHRVFGEIVRAFQDMTRACAFAAIGDSDLPKMLPQLACK
jgi:hypothetical protein